MQSKWMRLVAVLAIFFSCSSVFAQYARTVSRANCLVPTNPLLSPTSGFTFNESISWDPKFWKGHYVTATSKHMWSRWTGQASPPIHPLACSLRAVFLVNSRPGSFAAARALD